MNVNDKAPEFTLPDQNGEDISLKQFRGKYVVLYFYPRDDTPGCTKEACSFRDAYKDFQKRGALVSVRRLDGAALMSDVSEARESGSGVAWDRQVLTESRYYGLGPRSDTVFDLRGKTPQPDSPGH